MDQVETTRIAYIPKVFVICNQADTAAVWGYILRQKGITVILETTVEKAVERWYVEAPDLIVIDVDIAQKGPLELYQKFRALSVAPILLLLPTYHENQVLEAYASGVDDVIIKPISPAIFLAKILAWGRRSWTVSVDGLDHVLAGGYRLDPAQRCVVNPEGLEIKLTNLEFRLLHLLMSRPGHVFRTDDIVQSTWNGYGYGDQVLLKNVVYRLRKKIEINPNTPAHLRTEPGGYTFQG
jgi:two-component system KDP operon response regulator KdpE